MSEKKVYFDEERQWQVEEIGSSIVAGSDAVNVKLQVIGSDYKYYVSEHEFDSGRFEEVEG